MSQREENKRVRRQKILSTAEALIRANGGVDFSMRLLAKEAGVAFVTPFKLFESKGNLLATLLSVKMEANRANIKDNSSSKNLITQFLDFGEQSAIAFTKDAILFRPLVAEIRNMPETEARFGIDSGGRLWQPFLQQLQDAGSLPEQLNTKVLARSIHLVFRGLLRLWAAKEIEDDEFIHQVKMSIVCWMLPMANGDTLTTLTKKHTALMKALTKLDPELA